MTPPLSAECQVEKKALSILTFSEAQGMPYLGDILGTFQGIFLFFVYIWLSYCYLSSILEKIEKEGANLPREIRLQISLTDKQIEELEKLAKEKEFARSAILALALEEYSRKELEQKE